MAYDPQNVFARILRGEVPSDRVYEDDEFIAFRDIRPAAPVHLLVIPRGEPPVSTVGLTDADAGLIGRLMLVGTRVARIAGLNARGYRLVLNAGDDAGQEVPHLHLHVLGGGMLGPIA